MKNKISFVAVGQAAGNIGRLFEENGFSVIYVNTSREDLDTLEKAKFKYHIPQGEGCNKDRRKAKQLVIDDFDNIAAEIESKAKSEMTFVIFASGGGTGSGAGPMLIDLLTGEAIPLVSETHKSSDFVEFLKLLNAKYPEGDTIRLILDNHSSHKSKETKLFLATLPEGRFVFVFTPTHAS